MRTPLGVIIFLSLMLLLDLYVFQSIKIVTNTSTIRTRNFIVFLFILDRAEEWTGIHRGCGIHQWHFAQ